MPGLRIDNALTTIYSERSYTTNRAMNSQYDNFTQNANSKIKWSRQEVAKGVVDFLSRKQEISQREFAKETGIPRATIHNWVRRYNTIDEDPALVAFFESPAGANFLHLLIHALHLEFTKVGCGSIHNVCNFLEICKLSKFVASSYGTHQKNSSQMDRMVENFGDMERVRLSEDMPKKLITICEDETFHPQICLVEIEPESNFILLEEYADDRSAATWNEAVNAGLADLPVKIIQNTSDEGKGLISHVTNGLDAHHSPDIFMYNMKSGRELQARLPLRCDRPKKRLKNAQTPAKKP